MILNRLADATRARYARRMADTPLDIVKSRALALPKGNFAFERALEAPGVSLICEVKKASPSKGLISPDFPYLDIARDYAAAGAAAISCLTEPDYFLGDDRYLQEIAAAVPIPVLRKDFTLYDYQIYEAKVLGAGAVLLICALLDTDTLRRYIEICDTLGLSALVEAHDGREIASALAAGGDPLCVRKRHYHPGGYRSAAPKRHGRRPNRRGADARHEPTGSGGGPAAMTRIKICGLRTPADIAAANESRPDYIGFILSPGYRRSITKEQALALREQLDPGIVPVGVFVNATPAYMQACVDCGAIDAVQFHGQESPADCAAIHGAKKIKVFVTGEDQPAPPGSYPVDYLLFDSGRGDGIAPKDRQIPPCDRPFFLAGGLNTENMAETIAAFSPYGVDLSSAAETNGVKDKNKMQKLVRSVHHE